MIAYHYLLISSALDCSATAPMAAACMAQGRISEAMTAASAACDVAEAPLVVARLRQVCGDLHLLRGALEDAEETYRHSLKPLEPSLETQALSCRSAGLLSMFQQRFETAASCFRKIVRTGCSAPLRFEACLFLAQILFETGLRPQAREMLASGAREAQAADLPGWQQLLLLLLHDFHTRAQVQHHPEMRDDIYWQSLDASPPPVDATELPAASVPFDAATTRLIEQRAVHLGCVAALAQGQGGNDIVLQACLANTRVLSPQCHQTVLLELTQAALAGKQVHVAEILLAGGRAGAPQRSQAGADGSDPQQRQLVYCHAKLRLLRGLAEEGLALYASYALLAMQAMRSAYPIAQRFDEKPPSHYAVVKDDISARLPARYRRAYQFMLAQAHLPSLSITDVANVIGVSERALQLAFKEHIGLSPREVLRRHRMQKIREDLQEATGAGVMEVAIKHGIKNRTALTAGYRRYYNETPSKTTMG